MMKKAKRANAVPKAMKSKKTATPMKKTGLAGLGFANFGKTVKMYRKKK